MATKRTPNFNESTPSTAPQATASAPSNTKSGGFFLNAANWLLSRLPWFKNHYQAWSKTRRIVVGMLMYLVCLPIIPLVVGIVMYIHDPEGFRKGNAIKVLGAVFVIWAGAFGLIATQPAVPDNPLNHDIKVANSAEAKQTDNSDSQPIDQSSKERKDIQSKAVSNPTNGKFFVNCTAAFKAGVFNIPKGDKSYRPELDGDKDGVGCEK